MQLSSPLDGFDPFCFYSMTSSGPAARFLCLCLCVFNSPVSVYLNDAPFSFGRSLCVCLFPSVKRGAFFPAFRAVCAHKEKGKHSSII
jgi:hypothetical protein